MTREGAFLETDLAIHVPERIRELEEYPGTGVNENCYVDVHFPVKKALSFLQILCRVFSPLQKVRNN